MFISAPHSLLNRVKHKEVSPENYQVTHREHGSAGWLRDDADKNPAGPTGELPALRSGSGLSTLRRMAS